MDKPKAGERLDVYIRRVQNCSRKQARELCKNGEVMINGRASLSSGQTLGSSDSVELLSLPQKVLPRPELVERQGGIEKILPIVYQDKDLVVFDKPRGMHSVLQQLEDPITVADCVAAFDKNAASSSPKPVDGGLVNRLDFYTSGLIVAARNPKVWQALHQLFLGEEISKNYLALVEGRPGSKNTLRHNILQGKKAKIMEEASAKTRAVELSLELEEEIGRFSVVAIRARHLLRHQVRAQLAASGHPLVGDELYGAKYSLSEAVAAGFPSSKPKEGFWLRAKKLQLIHPVSNKKVEFSL